MLHSFPQRELEVDGSLHGFPAEQYPARACCAHEAYDLLSRRPTAKRHSDHEAVKGLSTFIFRQGITTRGPTSRYLHHQIEPACASNDFSCSYHLRLEIVAGWTWGLIFCSPSTRRYTRFQRRSTWECRSTKRAQYFACAVRVGRIVCR